MIGDRATSDWLTTSGDSLLRAAAGSRRRDPTFQQHAAPMHTYRGASPFCRCCRGGCVGVGGRGEGVQRGRGAEGRAQRGSSASCAPPPWPVPTDHVPDPATGTDKDPLDDPLDQMQQEGRRAHQQHRADPRQRSGSNSPRAQKNTYRKASQPIDVGCGELTKTFLPHQRSEGLRALVNPVRVEPRWQRAGSGRTRDDRSLRRALAYDAEERRAEERAACSEAQKPKHSCASKLTSKLADKLNNGQQRSARVGSV